MDDSSGGLAVRHGRILSAGGWRLPVRFDEAQFAEDVSLMLRCGLSLLDSLTTLRERSAAAAQPLEGVITRLRQGKSLTQAMQCSGAFAPALLACVQASETTGDMGASLHRYAVNAARLDALRSRMASVLVCTALLAGTVTVVVALLLLCVAPRLALGALVLWGAFNLVRTARDPRRGTWLTTIATRIPGVRDVVRAFGHSQFTRSGAMLLRSGVPASNALGMCRQILVGDDRAALDQALTATSAGAPLAEALHEHALIDMLGLHLLRVAKQTGALAAALERLADVHDRALERAFDRMGRLFRPLLLLGLGLFLASVALLI